MNRLRACQTLLKMGHMSFLPRRQHKRWHLWRLVTSWAWHILFLFVVSSCHWLAGSKSYGSKSLLLKWDASKFSDFSSEKFPGDLVEICIFFYTFENWYSFLKKFVIFRLLGRAKLWRNRGEQRHYQQKSCSFLLSSNKSNKHMMVLHDCKTLSLSLSLSFCFFSVSKATHSFILVFDFLHCSFMWTTTLQL